MRRRKPRVIWLPNSRSNRLNVTGDATDGKANSLFRFILDVPNDGTIVTGIIPVVADTPPNLGLAGPINSLSDIENSAYRLRRVVGKFFIGARQDLGQQSIIWEHAVITIGLIVLRVKDDGTPLAANLADYSANMLDSISDPWIWRRTYGVGNNAQILQNGSTLPFWPETNLTQGSALDGPHVDQKTARIISSEERLFFVASGASAGGTAPQATLTSEVEIIGDVRVLASMRTSGGNRRNASR